MGSKGERGPGLWIQGEMYGAGARLRAEPWGSLGVLAPRLSAPSPCEWLGHPPPPPRAVQRKVCCLLCKWPTLKVPATISSALGLSQPLPPRAAGGRA